MSSTTTTTPSKRISEYRKITTNEEFKDKRKEKQDIQRQLLKNQLILEKRQKLSSLNQNTLLTIDTIRNELKELHNKLRLLNQHKKFSPHQRKQILVSLRNLLSSNNSNVAVDLLVNYKDDSNSLNKSTSLNNNNKMDLTTTTTTTTTTNSSNNNNTNNNNNNNNNIFIIFLIKMLNDPLDDSNQLDAAWCITNIASCEHEHTKSILVSTPLLINHLSTRNSTLQDQCSWALGNIALDSIEQRDILLHQGILLPIVEMLSSKIPSLTITTCFTLSSLLSSNLPTKQYYLDLFRDGAVFQLLNDQVLFRKNRIENSSHHSSNSGSSAQVEVLNYLLWLFNDLLFQFDSFSQLYPSEYLGVESKLIKSGSALISTVLIVLDLFINIFNNSNYSGSGSSLKLLVIPCIRILSLVVVEPKIFIPILNESQNKIKSLIETINNSLVLDSGVCIDDNALLKEVVYFLSNLSSYSNQQNQINSLILNNSNSNNQSSIVNNLINRFNSQSDNSIGEGSSIRHEIIFLVSNIYLDKSLSEESFSIINQIVKNQVGFILPILVGSITDYQLNILEQHQHYQKNQSLQNLQSSFDNSCEFLNSITPQLNIQFYESGFNEILILNQDLERFNSFCNTNISCNKYFSLIDNISKIINNKQ